MSSILHWMAADQGLWGVVCMGPEVLQRNLPNAKPIGVTVLYRHSFFGLETTSSPCRWRAQGDQGLHSSGKIIVAIGKHWLARDRVCVCVCTCVPVLGLLGRWFGANSLALLRQCRSAGTVNEPLQGAQELLRVKEKAQ